MQLQSDRALDVLDGHQYANLTTFRRDGRAVATPVWFAREGDRLYVMTMRDTGKVKRLRNNSAARIGPSDRAGKPLGPQVDVFGRELAAGESAPARRALGRKYGLMKRLFDLAIALRGASAKQVFLELRVAQGDTR